jgi:hypothetical protein
MRILFGVAALAFVAACAGAPETPAVSLAPGAPKSDKTAETGKTCRRVAVIGSNMTQKVCSTANEWADYDSRGRESVQDFERSKDRSSDLSGGVQIN